MVEAVALTKCCTACGQLKPPAEFYYRTDSGRLHTQCKACLREQMKNRHAKNRNINLEKMKARSKTIQINGFTKGKDYHLQQDHGISSYEFARMLKRQGYKCVCCGAAFEQSKKTHIDHDHKTGAIRGILCQGCNLVIGHSRENLETLRKIIKYLRRFS